MALDFDIGRILSQYGGNTGGTSQNVEQDFDQISRNVPEDHLAEGLNEAFRSDQTPPFPDMAGQLFGQANPQQRAGMMNQLLAALGPAVIGSMLNRGASGGGGMGGMGGMTGGMGNGVFGSVLGSLLGQQGGSLRQEDVEKMHPDDFREVARRAEQENPGIIDQMSRFYAQNPDLVKGLGGAALAIALGRMAQRNR